MNASFHVSFDAFGKLNLQFAERIVNEFKGEAHARSSSRTGGDTGRS